MAETPILHWKYPDDYQPDWYLGPNGHVQLFTAIDAAVAGVATILNVKNFGARGDGVTDDTVAIQAAINSVPPGPGSGFGYGNLIFFPAGRYVLSNQIVVDRQITLAGSGPVSHLYQTNASANILFITTTGTFPPNAPYPDNTSQVTVRDLALSYSTAGTTGTAAIYSDPGGPEGLMGYMPFGNRFINLDVANGWDNFHFERGAYFMINKCFITGAQRYGVYIRNITSQLSGDNQISDCLFWDRQESSEVYQTEASVYLRSSGGLRMVNNKTLGGAYSFIADLEGFTSTLNIVNCSMGGILGGMKLFANAGAFIGTTVTGCTFDTESTAPFVCCEVQGQFQVLSFTGNNFYLAANNGTGLKLTPSAGAPQYVNVSGNNFTAYTGGNLTAIDVGASVQQMTIHGNGYHGVFGRKFKNLSGQAQIHYHDGFRSYTMITGDSGTLSNFSTIQNFNKHVTIAGGDADILGARIHVHLAGRVTTLTGTAGTLTLATFIAGLQYQATLPIPLVSGMTGQAWSLDTYLTVVAVGATVGAVSILQDSGGIGGIGVTTAPISTSLQIPVDLTTPWIIYGSAQFSVANANNTINLTTFQVDIIPAVGGTF